MVIKKLSSLCIRINYSGKKITEERNVKKKNENRILGSKKVRKLKDSFVDRRIIILSLQSIRIHEKDEHS